MPRGHIVFQAFPATPITPVDCCRRSQPRTDPLFSGILRFVQRIPAVCSAESCGLFCGSLQFVLRNPSVCTSENSGFHARNRWFPPWKPMVYSVENAGFSRGAQRSAVESATAKRMGWDAKQAEKTTSTMSTSGRAAMGMDAKQAEKAIYLPHFAKNLSLYHHICHLAAHWLPAV